MARYQNKDRRDLSDEQERRMHEGTVMILSALAVGFAVLLIIWSLPDWQWVIDSGFKR